MAATLKPVQAKPAAQRQVFDPASGAFIDTPVYERSDDSEAISAAGPHPTL
jgi:hypothetical protein